MGEHAVPSAPDHGRGDVELESSLDARVLMGDRQIPLRVSDERASVLASVGRTEDVAVSPDGSLIVLAGFNRNCLCLIRFDVDDDAVEIGDVRLISVEGLVRPHGVAFLDDSTLLVANRESELSLVGLDDRRRVAVSASVLIDGSASVPVRTPGSVAVRQIGADLAEVFVCNNFAHDVTRYVVDGQDDWSIIDAERLLATDLHIPDGVALSRNGDWIAVSNHNLNAVYVYRYDDALTADSPPAGVLRGINYPHGLAFADGDRQLVVADAGLPNLHTFVAADGDWSGERWPCKTDRIMDEPSFHRGRANPQEGGPKGLEIVAGRLVAVTSEFQPLAFFELHRGESTVEQVTPIGVHAARMISTSNDVRTPVLRLAQRHRHVVDGMTRMSIERDAEHLERERLRLELEVCGAERDEARAARSAVEAEADDVRRELRHVRGHHANAAAEMDRLIERVATLESHVDEIHASTSWRWTAPLRACSWFVQRARSFRR